ncbi:MAG TPA: hypothetical protein VN026_15255 [Bacteroidia bacterium]|jgi:hypothetical protein|nr:hypothetical protein [Bacteroidia bacterium]
MFKQFLFFVFIALGISLKSQEIKPTDIMEGKAIVVMPGITKSQLDSLTAAFGKYQEITSAIYVYRNHNCLLVTLGANGILTHYTDLLKIIQVATNITSLERSLKSPLAYDEIIGKNDDNSNVIVK